MNIAICDDDIISIQYIEHLIRDTTNYECNISSYTNGHALEYYIEYIVRGNVDIVILDIDFGLNQYNGIDIAKRIKSKFPHIKIIFITGYIDYSQDIFESHPTYFLVKPVKEEKLNMALDMAKKEMDADKCLTISVIVKGAVINIPINYIRYIESSGRIIIIHESDMIRQVYGKLDEWESKLPCNFIRCHQSYIINMDRVCHLNMYHFLLNNGEKIPVSQSRYNDTKKTFISYVGASL